MAHFCRVLVLSVRCRAYNLTFKRGKLIQPIYHSKAIYVFHWIFLFKDSFCSIINGRNCSHFQLSCSLVISHQLDCLCWWFVFFCSIFSSYLHFVSFYFGLCKNIWKILTADWFNSIEKCYYFFFRIKLFVQVLWMSLVVLHYIVILLILSWYAARQQFKSTTIKKKMNDFTLVTHPRHCLSHGQHAGTHTAGFSCNALFLYENVTIPCVPFPSSLHYKITIIPQFGDSFTASRKTAQGCGLFENY